MLNPKINPPKHYLILILLFTHKYSFLLTWPQETMSITYFTKWCLCDIFSTAKYGTDHCLCRASTFSPQINETQPHHPVTWDKTQPTRNQWEFCSWSQWKQGFSNGLCIKWPFWDSLTSRGDLMLIRNTSMNTICNLRRKRIAPWKLC